MVVILARDKRQLFWPLHSQFRDTGVEVIVDRRYEERRSQTRTSGVDRRYSDRRGAPLDEQLREQGWAVLGDDVRRRARVEWILERTVMSPRGRE